MDSAHGSTIGGDVAINYYYQVRATCIGAHADANDVGEFDFGLVPGVQ